MAFLVGLNTLSKVVRSERQLWAMSQAFLEGIGIIERARQMADKTHAPGLRFGYGLPLPVAREWGLYISESRGKTSIGIDEPPRFAEPGVFLVRPDATLYYGAVQTMPFARPRFDELLVAVDYAIEKNYPARGEYVGPL
jgi:hypothetical protein